MNDSEAVKNRRSRLPFWRIALALVAAVMADGLQILFTAILPIPEIIDVAAAGIMFWLLGFHWLLLPTFALEFVPVLDDLPTWTGCVVAVVALRKRAELAANSPAPPALLK